jgi:hypothetical protein
MIYVIANSNKLQKTKFWKEKLVENMVIPPKFDIGSKV